MTTAQGLDIADRRSTDIAFHLLNQQVESALRGGDRDYVAGLQPILADLTAQAISGPRVDVRVVAHLREHLRQLVWQCEEATESRSLADHLKAGLESLDGVLEAGQTRARMTQAEERRNRETLVLRDQILMLLERGPLRPRDLSTELGVASTQISRALRELLRNGFVTAVEAPAGDTDRRAHWYGPCAVPA